MAVCLKFKASALLSLIFTLLAVTPVYAQTSFPTAASGVRASATVPLQCDASSANCAPPSTTNPVPMTATGNVAAGATDSGNPVKIGARYSTSLPTLTDGQRGDLQIGTRGALAVTLFTQDSSQSINSGAPADATSASAFRLRTSSMLELYNGSTTSMGRGDANGLVVQPGLTSTFWSYTSGVTSILSNTTTAVTIKAAAGASVRNYIDSCQLTTTAFGASVPLALRDGAGGTVKFALIVPTAGFPQPVVVNFSPPLQGTANTLWEVATPTANTTGTVNLNCSGHTGI